MLLFDGKAKLIIISSSSSSRRAHSTDSLKTLSSLSHSLFSSLFSSLSHSLSPISLALYFFSPFFSHPHFGSLSFFPSLCLSRRGCPLGVIVKAMDGGIVVSEFVLQSRYYVHFQAITLEKGMNPLIFPAMG